jgi:hypothetical protein
MADEADRAQDQEAANLAQALKRRRKTLQATGACHYCGEHVAKGFIFCDVECGREYEREQAIRARQGR